MTRHLRAVLVAALALSLVAGAGCGGDTKKNNDYVDAVNKVSNDFAKSVNDVTASSNPAQAKDTFSQLKTAVDKVIADLRNVEPPDKVKDLHNELVGELQAFDDAVGKAGDAVASGDPQKILGAQTTFANEVSKVATKIPTTISAINEKLQGK
jgi:hypothetical protein